MPVQQLGSRESEKTLGNFVNQGMTKPARVRDTSDRPNTQEGTAKSKFVQGKGGQRGRMARF